MKRFFFLRSLLFFIACLLVVPCSAHAELKNFQAADVVVGQPDFTSSAANNGGRSAKTFNLPTVGLYADGTKLFVSDRDNNRVLIWNSIPTTNGVPADVVLGQADFASGTANRGGGVAANTLCNPEGIWTDGKKLIISDRCNHRILIWNSIPSTNGAPADLVIGQTDLVTGSAGTSRIKLNTPRGLTSDGKRLFVIEHGNHRLLIWNSIPSTNGAPADVVLGQPDFTSGSANRGGNPGADTMNIPLGVATDGKKLVVAEYSNARVLIWNSIPTENGTPADIVLGEPDFRTVTGGRSARSLSNSEGVYYDGKRLFVADQANDRILIWNTLPSASFAPADIVLGQPDFTSGGAALSARSLSGSISVFHDGKKLFVGDAGNNRVLIYNIGSFPAIDLSPQFEQGKAVLGKVFWDWNSDGIQNSGAVPSKARDGNGRQDPPESNTDVGARFIAPATLPADKPDKTESGAVNRAPTYPTESGIEGVRVVSDTGIYAITDHDGKYHYPFIETGQRVLKIDPATLPEGAILTTDNPRKITVTEGILTKVSFGVTTSTPHLTSPREAGGGMEGGEGAATSGFATGTGTTPLLEVSISQDPTRLKPHLSITAEILRSAQDDSERLLFTIETNYARFIDRGEIILYDEDYTPTRTIALSKPLPSQYSIPRATHDNNKILYYQLRVFDSQGNEDRTAVGKLTMNHEP